MKLCQLVEMTAGEHKAVLSVFKKWDLSSVWLKPPKQLSKHNWLAIQQEWQAAQERRNEMPNEEFGIIHYRWNELNDWAQNHKVILPPLPPLPKQSKPHEQSIDWEALDKYLADRRQQRLYKQRQQEQEQVNNSSIRTHKMSASDERAMLARNRRR